MAKRTEFEPKPKLRDGDCGIIALQIALSSLGIDTDRQVLEKTVRFTEEYGTDMKGMVEGANYYARGTVLQEFGIENLGVIARRLPVIVDFMNSDDMKHPDNEEDGHYALLEKVTEDGVYLFDREGKFSYPKSEFLERWYDVDRDHKGTVKNWAMVVFQEKVEEPEPEKAPDKLEYDDPPEGETCSKCGTLLKDGKCPKCQLIE